MSEVPKPHPARKAKVFRGARERIVDTEGRLENTRQSLNREQYERRSAEDERDRLSEVVHGPMGEAYLQSFYRQVGAQMADMAFKEVMEKVGEDLAAGVTENVIRALADDYGHRAASEIVDAQRPRATFSAKAPEEFYEMESLETVVHARTDIPPICVHHVQRFMRPL